MQPFVLQVKQKCERPSSQVEAPPVEPCMMGAGAAAHLLPASSEMTEDAEFEYIPNSPEAGKPKQSPVPPSMTKGQPMRQRRVESFQMESHRFRAGAKLFAPYPRWFPSELRMRLWCVKQRTTVRQRAIYLNWVMNSNMKSVSNWMISRGISWRPSIGRQEMVPSAILARTPSESLDLKGVYRDFF